MNKLEKITSIVILSAMPYILKAQNIDDQLNKSIDQNELYASIVYRPRNREVSESPNYSPALEEKIESKKASKTITYSKLINFQEYHPLKIMPNNFHAEKPHGHEYEFPIGKHAGITFEEHILYNDGKLYFEHVSAKLVFHLGYHRKN
ncbi:MAG TPA: hypothetical protein VEC16_05405 [Alphaproteobacteria bacterium]|nr:hypothetical protein [Alphaproteobacteria bacterium]